MDKYSEVLLCLVVFLCITSNQGLLRGPWSSWSSCSSRCNGNQDRTRSCYASSGESCDGLTRESRSCNKDQCITTSITLCIVLGLLVLLALILVIYLAIKRRRIIKENDKEQLNVNAAEDYYDQSMIRGSSFGSRPHATTSSIASSRATIPTIAPYLPDLEEEGHTTQEYVNKAYYGDNDSLDKVSLSESIQEAKIDFEVETEEAHKNSPPAEPPKVTTMTFAGTQTENDYDDDDYDDELAVRLEVI